MATQNYRSIPAISIEQIMRFCRAIKIGELDECWPWTRVLSAGGYGLISIDARNYYSHRVAFELSGESLIRGFQVDYLCQNKKCCNPFHLEQVSRAEHSRRGVARREALNTDIAPRKIGTANKHKAIPPLTENDLKRYWNKVKIGSKDECWPWIPSLKNNQHGRIGMGGRKGQDFLAHRIGYFIGTGIDPIKGKLRHTCDYPPCQNPDHLIVGTQAENMVDMIQRGRKRQVAGESHPRAKLTADQVTEIQRRYIKDRQTDKNRNLGSFALAKEFGISITQVLTLVKGKQWKQNGTYIYSAKSKTQPNSNN